MQALSRGLKTEHLTTAGTMDCGEGRNVNSGAAHARLRSATEKVGDCVFYGTNTAFYTTSPYLVRNCREAMNCSQKKKRHPIGKSMYN
jgi:hypothetical protein